MIIPIFPSSIYSQKYKSKNLNLKDIEKECYQIKNFDIQGQKWSLKNYLGGYTSYSSIDQLHEFSSTFMDLKKWIDIQVLKYVDHLEMDLSAGELRMSNFWLNIMPPQVVHTMHIHPLSTISGTFYVKTPKNCSVLKFEDSRLAYHMASPPRKPNARPENQRFINYEPEAGSLVLFESWMRHEVPANPAKSDRISVSFNYDWYRC